MTPAVVEEEQALAAESWAFALQFYERPGVAEACLRLQTDADVDVMLLLVVVFALTNGRLALSAQDITAMDAICRPWREQIVRPLRALRVALKSGPDPAPSPDTELLRSRIKTSELSAERIENDLLAQALMQKTPAERPCTHDALVAAMRSVVLVALNTRGARPDEHVWLAVDTILAVADNIVQ